MRHSLLHRSGRVTEMIVVALLVAAATSCTERTGPEAPRIPASVDIVSGDAQEGTVGEQLPNPLVARVLDANGQPVPGQIVNFRVTAGGGSTFAGSALTNANGIAQELWTLGTVAGVEQTIEVRAVDNTSGAALVFGTFHAVARAGLPDTVRAISAVQHTGPVGAALPDSLRVQVVDRYGNPVPSVTVSWTATSAVGTLGRATDVTTATGHATTTFTAGTAPGALSVTASAGTRSVHFEINVTVGPAATITILSGQGQTATVGQPLAIDPSVRLTDAHGNPVPGVPLNFARLHGTLSNLANLTNESGIATARWTLGTVAGTNQLEVKLAGLASMVTFTATGTPDAPSYLLKVAGDNQVAQPGTAVAVAPRVLVRDQYHNAVPGTQVSFAPVTGGGSVAASTVTADASGAVTPGSWTLGPAKGTNRLAASAATMQTVTFTALAGDASPDIAVTIQQPTLAQIIGDTVFVYALVTTKYALASVRASVGSSQTNLYIDPYFSGSGIVNGMLVLPSEPFDTVDLFVTATDVNGGRTEAAIRVVHDRRPRIVITSPLIGNVARPTIHVSASCDEDNPAGCSSLVLSTGTTQLASGTTAIDATVSLSAYDGGAVTLTFTARDSRGQTATVTRSIFVESSSSLQPLVAGGGTAVDYNLGRLLYWDPVSKMFSLKTAATGVSELIPTTYNVSHPMGGGFVMPAGAIFWADLAGFPYRRVLEWRNGAFVVVGGDLIDVAGTYALLSNGQGLVLRDLSTETNTSIPLPSQYQSASVAPNGDVAYKIANGMLRYRAGVTTQIGGSFPADRTSRTNPITDGVNVVYRAVPVTQGGYGIWLYNGTSEVALAPRRDTTVTPVVDYAVNSGWTAFTSPDAANKLQIWTRSPAGVLRQATSFAVRSQIEAVGSDGTVIFNNAGRRYRVVPDAAPVDFMSTLGTVMWRENRFVVLIGSEAFEITP